MKELDTESEKSNTRPSTSSADEPVLVDGPSTPQGGPRKRKGKK